MNSQVEYWNNIFFEINDRKDQYDYWLDKYDSVLSMHKGEVILDLGCGGGGDTSYLVAKGHKVIACDFSDEALKNVNQKHPEVETRRFDMLDGLPFPNGFAFCIISDLSLHYFSYEDTMKIIAEIVRVLKSDGIILCRVNSTADINYGAMSGERIGDNYYMVDNCTKRFFDKKSLDTFFAGFKVNFVNEYTTTKYSKPKVVWEISLSKI